MFALDFRTSQTDRAARRKAGPRPGELARKPCTGPHGRLDRRSAVPAKLAPRRILLVEDNEDALKVWRIQA